MEPISPSVWRKAKRNTACSFAQQMVQDHQKANEELMKLAAERGFAAQGSKGSQPLKSEAAAETQAKQATAQLSGDAFDRKYMQDQERDHAQAIKLYEAAAANSKDEKLRQFATAQLPVLKHHLEMAQALNKGH